MLEEVSDLTALSTHGDATRSPSLRRSSGRHRYRLPRSDARCDAPRRYRSDGSGRATTGVRCPRTRTHIDIGIASRCRSSAGGVTRPRSASQKAPPRASRSRAFCDAFAWSISCAFWDTVLCRSASSRSPMRSRSGHRPLRRIVSPHVQRLPSGWSPWPGSNMKRQRSLGRPTVRSGRPVRQRAERVRRTRLFTASRRGRARRGRAGRQYAESPACGSCRATPRAGHRERARSSARRAPAARSPGHRR